MTMYWLGVITLPLIAAALFGVFMGWIWVTETMRARWGVTFEAKVRDTGKISDYTLRHEIWWERSFGPVFVGGWYREPPEYNKPSTRLFTRWIGFGSTDGACVMVLWKRDLGVHPFSCRSCDYTSDEYGDTHTHVEPLYRPAQPGATT